MKNRDGQRLLLVDDVYWGGRKRAGKRGRGASGKNPLVAALSLTPKGRPLYLKLSHLNGFTMGEIVAWTARFIEPGSHVVSDGLNCFPAVTENECQHEPIITHKNGRYDDKMVFQWLNTVIGNVKNALRGTYHAISSRHVRRYLAEFCYRFNHRFQLDEMVDRLLHDALHTMPIPQRLLKLAELRW